VRTVTAPQPAPAVEVERQYDVVLLGHFAVDRLVEGGEARIASGGAVYYGGLALARLGFRVAVITKLAREDFPRLEELRAAGIDVFAAPAPQTSGIENIYTQDLDRRTCRPLGFAGPFAPEEVPELEARTLLIGSIIAGEVEPPLLEELADRARQRGVRLALDLQGFIRAIEGDRLVFRKPSWLEWGLQLVDLLKADDAEAEFVTGERGLHQAARLLAAYGPQEVVLTHARGVLVHAAGHSYEFPFQPREVRGRTGRGDTCFASYVGFRLEKDPEEAARLAALVTSRKLEVTGPFQGSRADLL